MCGLTFRSVWPSTTTRFLPSMDVLPRNFFSKSLVVIGLRERYLLIASSVTAPSSAEEDFAAVADCWGAPWRFFPAICEPPPLAASADGGRLAFLAGGADSSPAFDAFDLPFDIPEQRNDKSLNDANRTRTSRASDNRTQQSLDNKITSTTNQT